MVTAQFSLALRQWFLFYVVEYATLYLLADLGVTDLNRWCNGGFGYEIGVRLHVGCRIWFD